MGTLVTLPFSSGFYFWIVRLILMLQNGRMVFKLMDNNIKKITRKSDIT